MRNAPVPVFAVKNYTPAHGIKDIVFPNALDTTEQDDLIMKIKALQHFFKAQLHIICVNTPALFRPEAEIKEKLAAFAERYMLQNFTINVFNYTDEESGILEFTNLINGDLIAMGTHGLTGLARFISGSVAEDVVNHLQYPVWTYCAKSSKILTIQKTESNGGRG